MKDEIKDIYLNTVAKLLRYKMCPITDEQPSKKKRNGQYVPDDIERPIFSTEVVAYSFLEFPALVWGKSICFGDERYNVHFVMQPLHKLYI